MAITSSYPLATPSMKDNLVGTKFIENKEPVTKSFNIGDIAELIGENIGPGGIISYGQLSRMTSSPVVFNALNVWQPLGVVATLNSLNSGMSLGTTDKFALKNISGSAKIFSVNAHLFMEAFHPSTFPAITICFAVNGTIISDSIIDIGYYGNISNSAMFDNNWLVELNNNSEVSIYIKVANTIPASATLLQGKLVASQV